MFLEELQVAKRAALAAGEAIMRHYNTDVEVIDKGGGHPVTAADHEANSAIRTLISQNFPQDGWLSEEDADDLKRLHQNRLWVIDPLDGTRDFIRHNPEFAVSVALVQGGQPVLGVIYNPVTKELFYGCQGQGVFYNDVAMQVSSRSDGKIKVLASQSEYHRGEWQRFQDVFEVVPTGGTAYKMALVACGQAEACFTLQPKSEWDICAGVFLVNAAGGAVTTTDGKAVAFNNQKPRFNNLLYSNGRCHAAILKVIQNESQNAPV